jgi:anaerobic magnesium-protoporphyrin IX monomethyl ester cyclase
MLSIGGPLIDAGHEVGLTNAEALQLSDIEISDRVAAFDPAVVMIGHSGSTPAHGTCLRLMAAIKVRCPKVITVYGGVHPTYHAHTTLEQAPQVDIIVRGEGEAIVVQLAEALDKQADIHSIKGLSFRHGHEIVETPPASLIEELDQYRVGWELIDSWDRHQCWGYDRAAVIQFSRGCPHQCSYCGQRDFWKRWRHRDPVRLAAEIAQLYREHKVRFFTFADENPTTSPKQWRRFLQAMVAEDVPVSLTAAIRATDICRDEAMLPLYRQAGFCAVLLGIETTDPQVIRDIRKGSDEYTDARAIRLLKQNNIISIAGHVTGLKDESWRSGWQSWRGLLAYDPDLLNAMYVTPLDWTPFWAETLDREIIDHDQKQWDFRHQVLATPHLKPWQLFWMVKITELAIHLRPRFLWRMLAHPDFQVRQQLRWCVWNAARVWRAEIRDFISRRSSVDHKKGHNGAPRMAAIQTRS